MIFRNSLATACLFLLVFFSINLYAETSQSEGIKSYINKPFEHPAIKMAIERYKNNLSWSIRNGEKTPTALSIPEKQQHSIVALQAGNSFTGYQTFCTGTLISDLVVVSAAHCVHQCEDNGTNCRDVPPSMTSIGFGATMANPVGRASIQKIFYHDKYDGVLDYDFSDYDVSVLILSEPASTKIPGIVPIPLNESAINNTNKNDVVQVVGYGTTFTNMDNQDKFWASLQIQIIGTLEIGVSDPANKQGVCQGDSGGPLLHDLGNGIVTIGVASGGPIVNSGNKNCVHPAYYCRIDKKIDYIKSITRQFETDCKVVCEGNSCGVINKCNCGDCEQDYECKSNTCVKVVDCEDTCKQFECGNVQECYCGSCGANQKCTYNKCFDDSTSKCKQVCKDIECGSSSGCECGTCEQDQTCESNKCIDKSLPESTDGDIDTTSGCSGDCNQDNSKDYCMKSGIHLCACKDSRWTLNDCVISCSTNNEEFSTCGFEPLTNEDACICKASAPQIDGDSIQGEIEISEQTDGSGADDSGSSGGCSSLHSINAIALILLVVILVYSRKRSFQS